MIGNIVASSIASLLTASPTLELAQALAGEMTQPVPTPLHRLWEDKSLIRDRARSLKKLLDWPTVNGVYLVGAPSMRAFAMNKDILDLTAQWWTPQRDYAESVQIALIREEAGLTARNKLNLISQLIAIPNLF